MSLLFSEKN